MLALVGVLNAHAQQSATKPEAVGLSAARLERIATVVQRGVDKGEIAGAVTHVASHGQVVWLHATGNQDRENAKPMRADSIFRICSMTKPITTFGSMLYEEGRFLLGSGGGLTGKVDKAEKIMRMQPLNSCRIET